VGNLACAMLLKMSILKMSSNTEIREKGECAAARAVGQGLCKYGINQNMTPLSLLQQPTIWTTADLIKNDELYSKRPCFHFPCCLMSGND